MIPPKKPFNDYKWRWATLTPTEGLNEPPIYLGVLRVLKTYEGFAPSSDEVATALSVVEQETRNKVKSRVSLQRSQERNLIRNSGQYWKALGLLGDSSGVISLTEFGRRVADGGITKDEFAATVIKTLVLPNRFIEDVSEWNCSGITIKPLEIILKILVALAENQTTKESYITPDELIKIIIPLAGTNASIQEYSESIALYRKGHLSLVDWPDCTPSANDQRMAREFLLFLWHYGFCNRTGHGRQREKYFLDMSAVPELDKLINLKIDVDEGTDITPLIRDTEFSAVTGRRRVQREIWERPQQTRFRKDVLAAYSNCCIITGERVSEVLEAAHIIPVKYKGSDTVDNSLCLRIDIHRLFDSGHLRISPSGELFLSEVAQQSQTYGCLPRDIILPSFLNRNSLKWRWQYD